MPGLQRSPLYEETKRPLVTADESDLAPEEMIDAYLGGTPFVDLLNLQVPFEMPQQTRFEHHWIIGGTGHGKTNAIGNILIADLGRVADGEASVVVIDSAESPSFQCSRNFHSSPRVISRRQTCAHRRLRCRVPGRA